ncbi:MAG: hypothetical protein K2N74_05220, partial [Clostridiales bacterium]|nr:hypothetical protein [Clostridiales bacterium]
IYGALGKEDGTIIDIGGASTEVCCRKEGKIVTAVSLNVGAVRLYDWCKDEREALLNTIKEKVTALAGVNLSGRVVAIGGTATTLASIKLELLQYDAKKIQDFEMTAEEVRMLAEKLISLSKEERKVLRGMDEKRADIIAGGALLLAEIMSTCKIERIYVSDRDNLEGYLILKGQAL